MCLPAVFRICFYTRIARIIDWGSIASSISSIIVVVLVVLTALVVLPVPQVFLFIRTPEPWKQGFYLGMFRCNKKTYHKYASANCKRTFGTLL
jgi:hypothetical protein